MGILVAYLLGILTAVKSEYKNSREIGSRPHFPESRPLPNAPISVACIPTPLSQEEAGKKKDRRRKTIAFWVEVISALVLTGYFGVTILIYMATSNQAESTHKTFAEIQKQTTMIRQQLVGTQAALIVFGQPRWEDTKRELSFQITNGGQVIGRLVKFDATIQRKSLPNKTPIGGAILVHSENEEIAKNATFPIKVTLPWRLPQEMKNVANWPGREFVTIDGAYTYDDGFGDTISHKFCFLWMAPWNQNSIPPMSVGWFGGGWASDGKEPCRTVEDMKAEFDETKRHIEENSKPAK